LLPLYLREYYKNDPLFKDSKIVTSAFNYETDGVTNRDDLIEKIKFDQIAEDKLEPFKNGAGDGFVRVAIENSDAVIKGSEALNDDLTKLLNDLNIPVLDYHPVDEFTEAYSNFYLNQVL